MAEKPKEMSEYLRNYQPPQTLERCSPTNHLHRAGVRSTKAANTNEPPILRKRKETDHKEKRTYTTDYEEHESQTPGYKAMQYKAGYRRVQFSMPTEYQLQYGWKSPLVQETTPLITAAAVKQKAASNQAHTKTKKDKTSSTKKSINPTCLTNEQGLLDNTGSHGNHKHTCASCHTCIHHTEQREGNSDTLTQSKIKKLQEKFEKRMENTEVKRHPLVNGGPIKQHTSTSTPIKSRKITGATNTIVKDKTKKASKPKNTGGHVPHKTKSITNTTTVPEHPKETQSTKELTDPNEGQQPGSKPHRRSPTYPLLTEYQVQFKPTARHFRKPDEPTNMQGPQNQVRDLIYGPPSWISSKPAHTPTNKHVTSRTIYSTEYSSNFVSPVGLKYFGGAWEGAPQPDLLLHPPTFKPPIKQVEPVSAPPPTDSQEPSQQTSVPSSWFGQVLELREKAHNYKKRGDGCHKILEKLKDEQLDLLERASSTSSIPSATSLSHDDHMIKDDIVLHDIECSNESVCGTDSSEERERERRESIPQPLNNTHYNNPHICTCTSGVPHTHVLESSESESQAESVRSHSPPFEVQRPNEHKTLTKHHPQIMQGSPKLRKSEGQPPTPELQHQVVVQPGISHHYINRTSPSKSPVLTSIPQTKTNPSIKKEPLLPYKPKAPVLIYGKPKPTAPPKLVSSRQPVHPKTIPSSTVPAVPQITLPHSHQSTPVKYTPRTQPVMSSSSTLPFQSTKPSSTCTLCGCNKPSTSNTTKPHAKPCDICNGPKSSCDTRGVSLKPTGTLKSSASADCEICQSVLTQYKSRYPPPRKHTNSLSTEPAQKRTPHLTSGPPQRHTATTPATIQPPSSYPHQYTIPQDSSFSLSPLSLSSNCSVASDILERAQRRRDNFWSKTANE